MDLGDLLPWMVVSAKPELQLLVDGRLVLTSTPKKSKHCMEDSHLDGGLFCLLSRPDVLFPQSLTRSLTIQAAYLEDLSSVQWEGLAGP